MHHEEIEINPAELLAALVENLNVQFFADTRTDAKRLYQTLAEGTEVPFMHMAFPDGNEIKCTLALDHSQHRRQIRLWSIPQVSGHYDAFNNDETERKSGFQHLATITRTT